MTEEHITPDQAGEMAAEAGVKTVVMTHLSPTVDPKDEYQVQYFSGPILLAKDLIHLIARRLTMRERCCHRSYCWMLAML
jgi:ribonuclease BN (tRNA processing enzyme)